MQTVKKSLKRDRNKGTALTLILIICVAALASSLIAGAALIKFACLRQRAQLAAEAGSLAAARALSTIVIDDPDYGYIALSDYAPSSAKLLGADGKPLPVTGINTVIATARTSMLIASKLNNHEMLRLARIDAQKANAASMRLTKVLKDSLATSRPVNLLDPSGKNSFTDKDGNVVQPAEQARMAFLKNIGLDKSQLKTFVLELGSLTPGASALTNTTIPKPLELALLPGGLGKSEYYPAFIDMPVNKESFVFTGVSKQSTLVADNYFRPQTGNMPASIIRLKAVLETSDSDSLGLNKIGAVACAAPFALADRQAPGTMVLGLPQGLPGSYFSMQDFLTDHRLTNAHAQVYAANGGDYPEDNQAELLPTNIEDSQSTVASVFALGLYDWLRTAHGQLKLDQALAVVGSRIQPSEGSFKPGESLVYRFTKDGGIAVEDYRVSDVAKQLVHENQLYTLLWGGLPASNGSWNLAFRDQVRKLGTTSGGKHGGQLMECDGSFRNIGTLTGDARVSSRKDSERKSYFDGGLAVEFVLSGDTTIVAAQ